MPQPILSIHCITYNHELYISDALDSFLQQVTTFDFEIVVGEDCSSDRTREIVNRYAALHPNRIRLITSAANVGANANFERTLRACRGKYIAICEGDDFWRDASKLQQQVQFLERNQDYVICYHDAIPFEDVDFDSSPQLPRHYQRDATSLELIRSRPISTLTACFRNFVGEIPLEMRHSPILDLCLWSLLGWYGKGKYLTTIRPAAYRKHAGGLMSLRSKAYRLRATAQAYLCLANYYDRLGLRNHSDYFSRSAAVATAASLPVQDRLLTLAGISDSLVAHPVSKLRSLGVRIRMR